MVDFTLSFVRFAGNFYAYLSNRQVFHQPVRLHSACYAENVVSLADKQSQSCTDEQKQDSRVINSSFIFVDKQALALSLRLGSNYAGRTVVLLGTG